MEMLRNPGHTAWNSKINLPVVSWPVGWLVSQENLLFSSYKIESDGLYYLQRIQSYKFDVRAGYQEISNTNRHGMSWWKEQKIRHSSDSQAIEGGGSNLLLKDIITFIIVII